LEKKIIYLIPSPLSETPIEGMLSPFSMEIIKTTQYYFVENVRTSRRFISSLKLGIPIDSLWFSELNKDTGEGDIKSLLKQIPEGVSQIGIMSEAGCPGIADPGSKLVAIAHGMNWEVMPLPGPSSLFLALMGSGFNGQQFTFHGYLPIKQDDRKVAIQKLEEEMLRKGGTQLFIETPYRNIPLLQDLVSTLQRDTLLCIASNLTSANQIIKTKKVEQWRNNIPEIHKIPTIFLIGRY
jgi:16S rRNA (cytidine1402-2'-O)-methyltransferase